MSLSPIQQSVTADAHASVSKIKQSVDIRLSQQFYACLLIIDAEGKKASSFAPGQEYFLDISFTEQKQEALQCKEITSVDWIKFKLELAGFPEAPSVIEIHEDVVSVNMGQQREFKHRFGLVTNEVLPVAELEILIKGFKSTEHAQGPREIELPIFEIPITLNGTYYLPDQELFDLCHVRLNSRLPEDIALLRVIRVSDNELELYGWGLPRLLRTPRIKVPSIKLADFVDGDTEPAQVIEIMKKFSRHSPTEFTHWIKALHRKHQGSLKLLISDDANSEIPWEMFRLPEVGNFLGEVWSIVRWMDIRDEHTHEYLSLELVAQQYIGDVLSYCDHEGAQVAREKSLLGELSSVMQSTLQTVYERLQRPMNNIAMVYLGAHGIFTYENNEYRIAVGNWHNPLERILALRLEQLPACQSHRPIFFVNACHSGRLVRDSWGLYGLPEVLLSRVASGYIGTLGPVNVDYTVEVAEFILKKARQDDGHVNPAEALRRLRAYAAQQERVADDAHKAEYQKRLVYTFMYIYFGNPYSELHLPLTQSKENDGE